MAMQVGRDAMRVMEELKSAQDALGKSVVAQEGLKGQLSMEVGGAGRC